MREPFIRIGDNGTVIDRGGGESEVNDTPSSEMPDRGDRTPQPTLEIHDFGKDRRRERERIEAIIYNPFSDPCKLPN
jgi:hypothetical protein